MEQIKIVIEDMPYSVIGGDFWAMLEQVKSIPGRTIDRQKVWHLPSSIEEVRRQIQPYQMVTEDELLDAEVADVQRVQARLLEMRPAIEEKMSTLDDEIGRYSYRSKSRIKGSMMQNNGCLYHALEYASMPVEKLTEPQIKTLYAALRRMGEE